MTHPSITAGYSPVEELANSISHGLGVALGVTGLVFLLLEAGSALAVTSYAIYGASLILLYLASTLYHSFRQPDLKLLFKRFDHIAIYLLIAGTYTPFMLVAVGGAWGWSIFGVIWGLALAGLVFKIFFINRFRKLSVVVYLLMGWLCVIAIKPIVESLTTLGLILLTAGGLAYSLGVIFYAWKKLPFNHAIWHLFVMAGSICHYFAIYGLN